MTNSITTENFIGTPHRVKIEVLPNIFVEKVDYIEEKKALSCDYGSFYDAETNQPLGKSIIRRKYFILDGKDLGTPVIKPQLYWKE